MANKLSRPINEGARRERADTVSVYSRMGNILVVKTAMPRTHKHGHTHGCSPQSEYCHDNNNNQKMVYVIHTYLV